MRLNWSKFTDFTEVCVFGTQRPISQRKCYSRDIVI